MASSSLDQSGVARSERAPVTISPVRPKRAASFGNSARAPSPKTMRGRRAMANGANGFIAQASGNKPRQETPLPRFRHHLGHFISPDEIVRCLLARRRVGLAGIELVKQEAGGIGRIL